MLRILCLAITVAVASAGSMNFQDCANNEISSITIDGCSGDTCVVHLGQKIKADIKFTANQDSEALELDAEAIVWGIHHAITGFDQNGCHYCKCPIKEGESYVIEFNESIPADFYTISAEVMLTIKGDSGTVGCAKVNIDIES